MRQSGDSGAVTEERDPADLAAVADLAVVQGDGVREDAGAGGVPASRGQDPAEGVRVSSSKIRAAAGKCRSYRANENRRSGQAHCGCVHGMPTACRILFKSSCLGPRMDANQRSFPREEVNSGSWRLGSAMEENRDWRACGLPLDWW